MGNALVVYRSKQSALPLKRLLEDNSTVDRVIVATVSSEISRAFSQHKAFEYIFISNGLPSADLAKFIDLCRETPGGQESVFVLTMATHELDSFAMANGMMLGIHGFLSEPFSADKIDQSLKLANAIRLQNSKRRIRTAAGLMLAQVLEESGSHPALGTDPVTVNLWQKVQNSCDKFKELTGESVTVSIVNELHSVPRQQRPQRYKAVTERLRLLLQKKSQPSA